MFPIRDEIAIATRSTMESQLAFLTSLTNKTLENVEKMMHLNINVVRTAVGESAAMAKQCIAAKDTQEFLSLAAAQAQPAVERVLSYSGNLASIAVDTQVEISKAADIRVSDATRRLMEFVEDAAKRAPTGSVGTIAIMRSAIDNANAGYAQFSKTTKQAVEALEANFNTAVKQMAPAAQAPSKTRSVRT